jgi:transposase
MKSSNAHGAEWKERRRLRALELRQDGWTYDEIAEALDVSKTAISHWMAGVERGGEEALLSRPRRGAAPRLAPWQLEMLPDLLSHGAERYGFLGQLWTCARVAVVISEEFGVSYHKAHVSRLLKALDWTPQLPIERDPRRDEEEIRRWRVEVWPGLKKRRVKSV